MPDTEVSIKLVEFESRIIKSDGDMKQTSFMINLEKYLKRYQSLSKHDYISTSIPDEIREFFDMSLPDGSIFDLVQSTMLKLYSDSTGYDFNPFECVDDSDDSDDFENPDNPPMKLKFSDILDSLRKSYKFKQNDVFSHYNKHLSAICNDRCHYVTNFSKFGWLERYQIIKNLSKEFQLNSGRRSLYTILFSLCDKFMYITLKEDEKIILKPITNENDTNILIKYVNVQRDIIHSDIKFLPCMQPGRFEIILKQTQN